MVTILDDNILFPDVENGTEEGLLAIGGDLSVDRLILAYQSGIFPWYEENEPILWWSPSKRMVLFPNELKISKSMKKLFRDDTFRVTYNTCFEAVIRACSKIKRVGQDDTWITNDMIHAYVKLHERGIVTSVEVWQNDDLVGGLYGVDLKSQKIFCGESMFSRVSNASKYGFISLVQLLKSRQYTLIDCQVHTDHLASLGAFEISRQDFMKFLKPD